MTVAKTNPPRLIAISAPTSRMPPTSRMSSANTPVVSGAANWRRRFGTEARRQAISGPTPVIASSASPRGTFT